MKKAGILTHYHKSINYGGVLQSFALVQYLLDNGVDAEQIKYKHALSFLTIIKNVMRNFLNVLTHPISFSLYLVRRYKFHVFRNQIPHNNKVVIDTTHAIISKYDLLITGSDQVWHPFVINKCYLLDFVVPSVRISYAASVACSEIPVLKENLYKKINSLDGISVRERSSLALLKKYVSKDIAVCCDPVFLLDKSFWIKMCEKKEIKKKYIFCYFLGKNSMGKSASKYISQKENIDIITLCNPNELKKEKIFLKRNSYIYSAGPKDFLNLIVNAEIILTDSFHATAFSIIFGRKFICFQRDETMDMENRILDLLNDFNCSEFFYSNFSTLTFVNFYKKLRYENTNFVDCLKLYRKDSVEYLKKYIDATDIS